MPSLTKTSTAGTGISYSVPLSIFKERSTRAEGSVILTRWAVLRVGSSLCTRQDRVVFSAGTGGTDGGKVTVAQ